MMRAEDDQPAKLLPFRSGGPQTICETAEQRLRESPYFFLRGVHCGFRDGVLTLRGKVPFSRLKQFAEVIVLRVDGVREVVNQVEVFDPVFQPASAQAVRSAG